MIMKLLLLFVVIALVSATTHHPSKRSSNVANVFLSKVKYLHRSKVCSAHVIPYPLNGIRLQQANDDTSKAARAYYDNFSIRLRFVPNGEVSKFQVAIEYKKPVEELSHNKVKIHFFNLLFTASLKISKRGQHCQRPQPSLLGFVELVKTDITWHRNKGHVIQHRGKNLAKNDNLQYVMTKSNPRHLFANDSTWARTTAIPLLTDYIVPLKYESTESIEVDFELFPDNLEYERLIEKKVFLVQTNRYSQVTKVISGVDVMMYLKYDTINVTNVPHLNLTNSHSLIQQITYPEKYASVITDLHRRRSGSVRDASLTYREQFPSFAGDTTLNPLPKSVHIYTV